MRAANHGTVQAPVVRATARGLLASALLMASAMGCVVQEAPASSAQGASKSPDCRTQQDNCVASCKAAAPDEASRQPCYTKCMRQSQSCQ